jgi:hypothetical protein
MKKVLVAVFLGLLFWCNVGFAMSQQEAIDKHLSERKLDSLEGVWSIVETGQIVLFFKTGNTYQFYDLTYPRYDPGRLEKGSDNYYYGRGAVFRDFNFTDPMFGNETTSINGNSAFTTLIIPNQQPIKWSMQRIWPTDLASYNAKFKTKKDIADEEKIVADMVADANKTCKVLGFKEGSEKFSDCALKLYTQKVDELVAEKKAANALMTQSQTTTTTQSSGSNTMTIYDPVRDSKALMKQGQKMLSGACTFGIDC